MGSVHMLISESYRIQIAVVKSRKIVFICYDLIHMERKPLPTLVCYKIKGFIFTQTPTSPAKPESDEFPWG